MKTFGRSTVDQSRFAEATVPSVSARAAGRPRSRPGRPRRRWRRRRGAGRRHASRTSSVVMRKTASSTSTPRPRPARAAARRRRRPGERAGEDRRVGGHAHDAVSSTSSARFPRAQALTREVVEPDRDSRLGQPCQGVLLGAMTIDPLLCARRPRSDRGRRARSDSELLVAGPARRRARRRCRGAGRRGPPRSTRARRRRRPRP